MVYMTKNQYDSELVKIQQRNQSREYKRLLREERRRHWPKFVKPATSKIMLAVSALLCLETLIFCQYMIIATGDTNALYAMVGALFTFMGSLLGYLVKATIENKRNGITFETAMVQLNKQSLTESEKVEAVG